MEFDKLLKLVVEKGASDLFITAGRPPTLKINGKLFAVSKNSLSPEQSREMVLGVMNREQQEVFKKDHECNFAIATRGLGRFRVSSFYQRNLIGMVLRRIEVNIPKVPELGLPSIIEELAMTKRGLIIFVGATGTGKSTSLAAMIGHRNEHSTGHIISIEDPIE
jgi:twitching motility protein PilU